jgi:putative oxidoreductase
MIVKKTIKELALFIVILLIVMMWLHASSSKYFDFAGFKRDMHKQPFPTWFSDILIIILPPIEITTAVIVAWQKTRRIGLVVTEVLMSAFTLYIIAIMFNFFPRVPCSCGGIIKSFTWEGHLIFNLFFVAIGITGLLLNKAPENNNIQKLKIENDHKNISRAKSG